MKSTPVRGKFILRGVLFGFFFVSVTFGTITQISYTATDLGSDRWEYTYTVYNLSLEQEIQEFTVWFDYDLYDNLTVTTADTPAGWDQIVWDPEPVLLDDGAYDAKAIPDDPWFNFGIGVDDDPVSGFSISFDWLGTGEPGSQLYHIVDPDNYPVPIETGYTVPEPTTLLLLGLGGLFLRRKQGRRN